MVFLASLLLFITLVITINKKSHREFNMDPKGLVLKTCAVAAFGLFSLQVSASTVTFNLDYEFSGAQEPQGASPWAVATIDDSFGDANTVRLTMEATNLVGAESVTSWFFNFSGDANLLSFNPYDTADATVNYIFTDSTDSNTALKADGDGFFDIKFDFAPPSGSFASRFTAGETIIYDLTYTAAPIVASDFNVFSASGGGTGSYLSAAHVQSIADPIYCSGSSDPACGSGWIGAVPVPAAVWLFGSGLLGLVGVARRCRA